MHGWALGESACWLLGFDPTHTHPSSVPLLPLLPPPPSSLAGALTNAQQVAKLNAQIRPYVTATPGAALPPCCPPARLPNRLPDRLPDRLPLRPCLRPLASSAAPGLVTPLATRPVFKMRSDLCSLLRSRGAARVRAVRRRVARTRPAGSLSPLAAPPLQPQPAAHAACHRSPAPRRPVAAPRRRPAPSLAPSLHPVVAPHRCTLALLAMGRSYLLRRQKNDVEKTLAPLEETIIWVEITLFQKKIYRAVRARLSLSKRVPF